MKALISSALAALIVFTSMALGAAEARQDDGEGGDMRNKPRSGYAPVNGLKIYYEIHGVADGKNPPLVLLHGGGDTIETSFGHVLPALARTRLVIAFEQQGYGHTADIADRPFSFEQSADDTAALLEYLHVDRADIFGFSNGGTIALQVAIRHPRVVRKLIAASAFFKRDGGYPWFWEAMQNARLENMPMELQEAYRKVAPHPENLRAFHDKAAQRMRDFKDIPTDAIRKIVAPTLVVIGDTDIVRPEHAVELSRLLPHAQLAVLPGTDHMAIMTRTDWVVTMVEAFLNAPMPEPKAKKSTTSSQKPEDWPRLFEQHLNAGDLDAVMALYEPEARLKEIICFVELFRYGKEADTG
jgi:pimeloyl-ACP methyl ester carboxylesterase